MNETTARSRGSYSWHHVLGALGLTSLGVVVCLDAWRGILQTALRDDESAYILLVPAVAAGMFWMRRGRLRRSSPRRLWIGPVILAAGAALLLLGEEYWIRTFRHAGAVAILAGCLLSVFGWDLLWHFLPAFGALAFLVPVPGIIRHEIAIPVQTELARVTQGIFDFLALPVCRSGNLLDVNGAYVAMGDGCTGLRAVFFLGFISFAFLFGRPLRNRTRILLLLASPLCVVAANVLRLVATAVIQWAFPQTHVHSLDAVLGWFMIPLAFLILLGMLGILRRTSVPIYRYGLAYDK